MQQHVADTDHANHAYTDITAFGQFYTSNDHSHAHELLGGRTAITTEAMYAYNGLRQFLGLQSVTMEAVGRWAFANTLTNNTQWWGGDLNGVGLYYAMQGAKVGWIRDGAFDPQILADIQRLARLGDPAEVMAMVEEFGHPGFRAFLAREGLEAHFINTLKMEPHYGGWMHGRTHGWLEILDESGRPEAIAHDLNHLTVLSHDQLQPFMNDTFDWPQWPALDVAHQDVIDYFQAMVVLGDPRGDALPDTTPGEPVFTDRVDVWAGTAAAESVNGLDGNDVLDGRGGDDVVDGGRGADLLVGGDGNDILIGGAGRDRLNGDAGNDTLYGNASSDVISGGDGDDALFGRIGTDDLSGGRGNDTLIGGAGADTLRFSVGGGHDRLWGFEDNVDTILLDDALWSGTLSAQQVVDLYAEAVGNRVVFTFAGGEMLTVFRVSDANTLVDDIAFF